MTHRASSCDVHPAGEFGMNLWSAIAVAGGVCLNVWLISFLRLTHRLSPCRRA